MTTNSNDYLKRLEEVDAFFSSYRNDISNLDNLIDFSNQKQRNLYYATWQLQLARQNFEKALSEL